MNALRIAITLFVVALLTLITLGVLWTGSHQPAPQSTASHIVLGVAGLAGLIALIGVWRYNPRRTA